MLTDFGIAQAEGDTRLTRAGLVMGSPCYIPPERVRGERAVPASDLWALGATLYAAVEGGPPFERADAAEALAAALSEPVPPARDAGRLWPVLRGPGLGGHPYAIYFRAPEAEWASSRSRLETFYTTFEPR
jgi:serine/threonine protein kinase